MNHSPLDIEQSAFWHPYTAIPHSGPGPARIVRAQGAFLFDELGHRLFDATASWWCQVHGHCHPRLVQALSSQASVLDQVLVAPHTHPVAEELSARLVSVAGAPFEKVFFSDNGSTAVEVALKIALQYWKLAGVPSRRRFLSFDLGYHGDTFGAMAVACPSDFVTAMPPLDGWSISVPAPYFYRRSNTAEGQAEFTQRMANAAMGVMRAHADELAAVILEPMVVGAGGLIPYDAEYLEAVVSEAKRLGLIVILDEVFTGFGRTGKMFAFEHISARPDIICLSKGLTSGMLPLGATLTTRAIFEPFVGGEGRRLAHGHTFTANALSCRVALESLAVFRDEATMDRVAELSVVMQTQASRLAAAPFVGDVRCLGMIAAFELVRDRETKEVGDPPNALGWALAEKLWKRGIWVRPLRQVLYVCPPYCVTRGDLQDCFAKLEEVLYEPV